MRLGAIILAGGRSTRMGRPKELLPFAGTTLLGHLAAALVDCTAPVVVVARDAVQTLPRLPAGVARCHDAVPDRGPLAGIAAGMQWLLGPGGLTDADAAFVTACDHPLLHAAAVRFLAGHLAGHDAVVPQPGGTPQPLCAVYRLRCHREFAAAATEAVGPRQLLPRLDVLALGETMLRACDATLAFLHNVNTPADLATLPPPPEGD